MSQYITVKCECGVEFDRFICHPYITKCKACRKKDKKPTITTGRVTTSKWNKKKDLQYLTNTGNYGKIIRPCCLKAILSMQAKGGFMIECAGQGCDNQFRTIKDDIFGFGYASYKLSDTEQSITLVRDYIDHQTEVQKAS